MVRVRFILQNIPDPERVSQWMSFDAVLGTAPLIGDQVIVKHKTIAADPPDEGEEPIQGELLGRVHDRKWLIGEISADTGIDMVATVGGIVGCTFNLDGPQPQ